MSLSIVIPTYNEEKELPNLFRSLRAQSYQDFEVIISDNHSTDSTRELAKEFGARIVDGGNPSEGRNNGARAAKNEIIIFFDADVTPPADFIEKALNEFQRRELDVASADNLPMSASMRDRIFYEIANKYFHLVENIFPHATGTFIITKKDIFEKIGGFDPQIKLAEDHQYAVDAMKYGKYGMLRSVKLPVSSRRVKKEGPAKFAVKMVGAELHLIFKGPIKSDVFKYRFGHNQAGKQDGIVNKEEK